MRKLALLLLILMFTGCLAFLPKKDGQFWWPAVGMPESELIEAWGSVGDNASVSTGGDPITIRSYEVTAFGNVFGGAYLYSTDNLFCSLLLRDRGKGWSHIGCHRGMKDGGQIFHFEKY